MKLISIITPCFNEEENIQECIERLRKVFEENLPNYKYEHIFTDNASTDNTMNLLRDEAKKDSRIKVLRNSKNIGAFKSMFSALSFTKGEIILVQLPADLQDPPEIIPQMLEIM